MNKTELLTRIRSFLAHSKKVHESSRKRFKTKMEYAEIMADLQFCKTALADLNELNSKFQIACRIKLLRSKLKGILPNANNDSYQSSKSELETIFSECLNAIGNHSGSRPERVQQ